MLPSEITSSISSADFAARMGSQELFTWRFSSEPVLSNVTAGVGDVSVELKGELYGTPKTPSAWAQQLSTEAGVAYNFEQEQLLTDPKGNLYYVILVNINNVNSFKATKFSKNGTVVWNKHYNRVSGFGNGPTILYNYSWSAKIGPQGLIIVAGQASNTFSNGSSNPFNINACNKVICINTGNGLIKWAKIVSPPVGSNNGLPYGHTFASVHVNNKTGHTYLVSVPSGAWAPGGFNINTLDSNGTISDNVATNFYSGLGVFTVNGGKSLDDGSMVIVGNYVKGSLRGAFYIILNASGSVKQSIRVLGETDNPSTAFTFQTHPLATVLANSNILWVGVNGIIEFNPDMSSVISYQNLGGVIDISERSDGSFAVLSSQVHPLGPRPSRHPNFCAASLKILNNSRSQVTAMKQIFLQANPYISVRLDGTTNKLDRYVFIPSNSKTLISINSTVNLWETEIEPIANGSGALTVTTLTTNLPINISSLTNPTITNPNFGYSTTGTVSSDYIGSVTVSNPTDSWTLYSSTT